MKKIVSMFMAVAVVFGMGLSQSRAADTKPIAAVALASYENLVNDVNFVGGLVDRPQLGAAIDGLLAMVTQGKGLAGIDKTRPWGAILQTGGPSPFSGYVFVPVTDFKAALGLLKLYSTVSSEGDVYKVTPKDGNKSAYCKQQGDWAFFADKPESLAQCDADPLALLRGLNKDYVIGGRIFLANVPEGLRGEFLKQVKQGLQKDAAQHEGESSEEFASRKKIIGQLESYLPRVFGELDQIVLGWGLDRTAETTFITVRLTAKSGTKTAEEMNLAGKAMTNFAGFHTAGAALNAAWAGLMPASKQEIATSVIEAARGKGLSEIEKQTPEDKRTLAKELFNQGADLLQKIVKSGHVDGAATVSVSPTAATGLLAGYVADGALLDKILHSIVKAITDEHPEIEQFVKLDAEKSNSISYHTISIPIPEYSEEAQKAVKLLGEKLEIVIGVGKENAYLAVGRDALSSLKKAIESSVKSGAKAVSPLEVSLAIKPIATLVADVGKPQEQPQAKIVAAELQKTPGKDHINLTVQPVANGVKLRLEVEQGLIRLIGTLVQAKTGQ